MRIPLRRIAVLLAACVLVLILLDAAPVFWRRVLGLAFPVLFEERVLLNAEANLPTWFSTVLLAAVSATAFFIYRLEPAPRAGNFLRRHFWATFSTVFAFLSLDEAARIHELIDETHVGKWVYFYAPAAALFFLACLYYFLRARAGGPQVRRWILTGLVVYAAGALMAEFIGYEMKLTSEALHAETVIEESLEMIGTILVLMGCLREFELRFNRRFAPADDRSA
jgi:hypothetical protein